MIDETITCEFCGLTKPNIPSWIFHKIVSHTAQVNEKIKSEERGIED